MPWPSSAFCTLQQGRELRPPGLSSRAASRPSKPLRSRTPTLPPRSNGGGPRRLRERGKLEALFRTRTGDPLSPSVIDAGPVPEGVRRGRNAEGVGLANRFAQKVDQRLVDARVPDASRSEKKPHGCSFARGVGVVLPSDRLSRGARIFVRRGSLGRNKLVRENRGQAEWLSRRISATRAGCSRAAKCPV